MRPSERISTLFRPVSVPGTWDNVPAGWEAPGSVSG